MQSRFAWAGALYGAAALISAGCAGSEPTTATASAERDLQAALAALPTVERVAYAAGEVPYFVRGSLGYATEAVDSVADADVALAGALHKIAPAVGIDAADLAPTKVSVDRLGMSHVRYAQSKNGLRVVGGEVILHVDADGQVRSVTSSAREDHTLPLAATVTADEAVHAARLSTADGRVDVGDARLVYVIDSKEQRLHLAWEVAVTGQDVLLIDDVYIDATSGQLVERRPHVHTARERNIFDFAGNVFGGGFYIPQQIGSEGMPPTSDPIGLKAYENTGATYDCYSELFGRDSYDGMGAELVSLVHVNFPGGPSGSTPNNAAWAGGSDLIEINWMLYGDGDGQFMGPTADSFDVTAHELTHGVTAATAKLTYMNESGALNEGWSDIMAAVCDAWKTGGVNELTWHIGEDIFTPNVAGDALRYMDDPTRDASLYPPELGGSRDFYADRYTGSEDNGGVHLNSGIVNLAFKLVVTGGTHPQGKSSVVVPAMGIEKAGAIFQHALTQGYLTATSNFEQARTATEEVAAELYSPGEATAVAMAWAAVGVGSAPAADGTPPTVTITSPADGAGVAPGFDVTVDAQDDQGVLRVELSIDGQLAGTMSTAPYVFTTDASLSAGSHEITATAYDSSNQATDSITVTVGGGGSCSSDTDCGTGEQCEAGVCVPEEGGQCTSDSDCGEGLHCEQGMCVRDGEPGDGDPTDPPDSGGGCTTGSGTSGSGVVLLLGLALLALRRRRCS